MTPKIVLFALLLPRIILPQQQNHLLQKSLRVAKESNSSRSQSSSVLTKEWTSFDGNDVQCFINNDGPSCNDPLTGASGLFWPKGSNLTAVFSAGIWITGIHRPTGRLRTAVEYYQTEFQPGPILSTFNTTTNSSTAAANPDDRRYHIYKINRGDENLPAGQRNPDYDNWPGDLGAPYQLTSTGMVSGIPGSISQNSTATRNYGVSITTRT